MAEAFERRLDGTVSERGLITEAPTGVGKSFAYLAPIIAAGRKAIVVTANIALGEQIVEKDFPSIAKALGSRSSAALAKGLNNYVCREKLGELETYEESARVVRFASLSETGDLSALDFVPSPRLLPLVTCSAEDCLKKACDHYEDVENRCFGIAAREKARSADVCVTNYHMLLIHLTILENGGEGILPPHDVLVLDEAHNLGDIARSFVGGKITEWAIKAALSPLSAQKSTRDARPALDERLHGKALAETSLLFARASRLKPGRISKEGSIDAVELFRLLQKARETYATAIQSITQIEKLGDPFKAGQHLPLNRWYAKQVGKDGKRLKGWVERLRIAGRSCIRNSEMLLNFDGLDNRAEMVYFTEFSEGRRGVSLNCAPIDPGPYLQRLIWNNPAFKTILATSATLKDGESSFDLVKKEMGADGAATLSVESPFDFSRCMLVCDSNWPEPKHPSFPKHIEDTLRKTILAAGGRTLGLFASYRSLKLAAEFALRERYRGPFKDFKIFVQGDAPRTELVRRFREDETSVLLGTKSFWEGVDVPGRSLSALWIEKIPFSTPDDPIYDELNERLGREAFLRYSLPRAVIGLRQGFGRLIRSMSDGGIIVVADPRILTASYAGRFLDTMPEGVVAGDWEAAGEHMVEILG